MIVPRLAATRVETMATVIVLAVVALLPVGRMAELPIAVGALCAIVLIARQRIMLRGDEAIGLATVLFACYWLPVVLSAFAAVAPAKTWMTAATTLRFLPFACFAVWALRPAQHWDRVIVAIAAVCLLWLIDAWVQIATGFSLGGAPEQERLSGIFGADNLKLGPVLATLAPFVLLAARRVAGRGGLLLAFFVVLVPVVMAGARAAWLAYAIVCTVFVWRETGSLRRFVPMLLGVALAMILAFVAIERDSSALQARVARTLLALDGTALSIDEASAGRVSIWRTSIAMIAAHPLTGVGARGFRHAYLEHAQAGDRFAYADAHTGASHAHQIVLEVLSETGVIGLLFWISGTFFAIRAWRRAGSAQRERAFAPALALVAMCFPLNTHLAFYSAWWGLLFWWLLALYCAALARASEDRSAFPA